jgi:hypothetical protein
MIVELVQAEAPQLRRTAREQAAAAAADGPAAASRSHRT